MQATAAMAASKPRVLRPRAPGAPGAPGQESPADYLRRTGGIAGTTQAAPRPALSMRPLQTTAAAPPPPVAKSVAPPPPVNARAVAPPPPVAKPMATAAVTVPNAKPVAFAGVPAALGVNSGKKGKGNGQGRGGGGGGQGKLPPVVSGEGKLPEVYTSTPAGGGNAGGGTSGNAGSGTQTPVPVTSDVNGGRVSLLESILANPESMTPEVQANILQGVRDSRDLMLQDEQRQIREMAGANGIGQSGVQDRLLFDAQLRRSSDLGNAQRQIATDAARTNFGDRINAVNTALQQTLGIGGLGLQYQNMTNQQFNQDRNFQLQLADALTQTGLIGQQQQSSLLAQMNALITGGMSWQDALKQSIMQSAYTRYADPNVGAVQQTGYAPNPYLDYMMQQEVNSGGGGGSSDWFNMAMQGGASLAGLFI